MTAAMGTAGQIYDNCRCEQGQIALAYKETASAPGECMCTCDLISKQAGPCQPECYQCHASHAPEQAALPPGAIELWGFHVLLIGVLVFCLPALSAARHCCCTANVTNSLCLCAYGSGLRGERAGAEPSLLGAARASQAGGRWMGLLLVLAFVLHQAS